METNSEWFINIFIAFITIGSLVAIVALVVRNKKIRKILNKFKAEHGGADEDFVINRIAKEKASPTADWFLIDALELFLKEKANDKEVAQMKLKKKEDSDKLFWNIWKIFIYSAYFIVISILLASILFALTFVSSGIQFSWIAVGIIATVITLIIVVISELNSD